MALTNEGRQAAMERAPAQGPDEADAMEGEAQPQEEPVSLQEIAQYLQVIGPQLPPEQQAAAAQAAQILGSVASPETQGASERPVESEGVNPEAQGGVPARQ